MNNGNVKFSTVLIVLTVFLMICLGLLGYMYKYL